MPAKDLSDAIIKRVGHLARVEGIDAATEYLAKQIRMICRLMHAKSNIDMDILKRNIERRFPSKAGQKRSRTLQVEFWYKPSC
jgi:Asp-tRNA(Asn)/Glu-tRNA(Gln) amidotransferase C subunit